MKLSFSDEELRFFKQIKEKFAAAEALAKRVEEFRDEAAIPALNELRYAGYHLSVYLGQVAAGETPDIEELRSAERHCMRAAYEAGEAGLLAGLSAVSQFRTEFQDVAITDVLKDWIEIQEFCHRLQDEVLGRNRENGDDRLQDSTLYTDAFVRLVEICRRLDLARDELNKKIAQMGEQTRRFLVTIVVGILAILATGVFGILQVMG